MRGALRRAKARDASSRRASIGERSYMKKNPYHFQRAPNGEMVIRDEKAASGGACSKGGGGGTPGTTP